ncbi:MAG: HD domain-containing protein [Proteobacteria bacterium]|nr:HD domain-containing protein [Pseudomonadota bacterium]
MITKEDIAEKFGKQLEKIKDQGLREKVVETWYIACKQGGWESFEEIETMPFTMLTDTHGVNFVEHTIAVTEGAVGLAEAQMATYKKMPYEIDMDRLLAGGILHDVGKLVETIKDGKGGFVKSLTGKCTRHPISGTVLAAKVDLDDKTLNTIACHAKEGDGRPQVVETVLIHQADFGTFNPLVMLNGGKLITE